MKGFGLRFLDFVLGVEPEKQRPKTEDPRPLQTWTI